MDSRVIIIAIVLILFIVLGVWYLYGLNQHSRSAQQNSRQTNQTPMADLTTSISSDLSNVPNDSATDNDMNSLDKDLQNF